MAKSKAKNVKKKVSSYDDKLIKIIAVSLTALVAVLVAVIVAVSIGSSYVCKVGGKRVMNYEYRYFLAVKAGEMEQEAKDALGEDEKFDSEKFWTEAKKNEAREAALTEACEWKANYLIAKKEGHGLSWKERNEYATELESSIQYAYTSYYYSNYSSSSSMPTYDQYKANFLSYYYAGMDYDEYVDFMIQNSAIGNFKTALENGYEPNLTDKQLEEEFNSDKDAYRQVILYTFAVKKPTEVKKPEGDEIKVKPVAPEGADKESQEYKDYQKELTNYNNWEKYRAYVDEIDELNEKMKAIHASLEKDGTYTGEGIKDAKATATATATAGATASATATATATADPSASATADANATEAASAEATETAPVATAAPKSGTASDNATAEATATAAPSASATAEASATATATAKPAKNNYEKITLSELAEKEGDLFASDKGKVEINSDTDTEKLLSDFALSIDWADDKRESLKSTSEEYTIESVLDADKKYSEGKVSTKPVLLSDEGYFYIVQCVGIKDLVTNKEPWETGEKDDKGNIVKDDDGNPAKESTCVYDTVKKAVLDGMSDDELTRLRGSEYTKQAKITSKKEKKLSEVTKDVFGA